MILTSKLRLFWILIKFSWWELSTWSTPELQCLSALHMLWYSSLAFVFPGRMIKFILVCSGLSQFQNWKPMSWELPHSQENWDSLLFCSQGCSLPELIEIVLYLHSPALSPGHPGTLQCRILRTVLSAGSSHLVFYNKNSRSHHNPNSE